MINMKFKIKEIKTEDRTSLNNPNEAVECSNCHQKIKPPYFMIEIGKRLGFGICKQCKDDNLKEA